MTLLDNLRAACADFRVSWDDFARDPVPPGHGERAGASPGLDPYCACGYPVAGYDRCPNCGRGQLLSFERPAHAGMSGLRPDGRHDGASA